MGKEKGQQWMGFMLRSSGGSSGQEVLNQTPTHPTHTYTLNTTWEGGGGGERGKARNLQPFECHFSNQQDEPNATDNNGAVV